VRISPLPRLKILLLGIAFFGIAAGASAEARPTSPRSTDHLLAPQDSGYAVQTSEGAITLAVQPRWAEGKLILEIEANTHTVPLNSLDLAAQLRLIIAGDSIAPDAAGELSGHHGSTTVEFRLESRPAEFTLEVRDVPDVPLRSFTWPAKESGAEGNPELRPAESVAR
jgi:hypothetical protein